MATYAILFEGPWERIPMVAQNTPQWSAMVKSHSLKKKMPSERDYTLDCAPWLHIRIIWGAFSKDQYLGSIPTACNSIGQG